ncbi:MAG: NADH-quinone oxidoreductase subunit C [Nitrospirae bacterium]|nr:NADH-quinone oxidoreductase subunit C [Nitrospirota bacterium]
MEPLEIANKLKEKFPDEVIDIADFRGQVSVSVNRDRVLDICGYLYNEPDISMNYLSDLCGVDYPEKKFRFEVVYNLYSLKHRHALRVKALIPEHEPSVNSVTGVWAGANWHEREAYDMYGIIFKGHPDLRRILLPEDWEGFPQRKNYPLKGPEGWEYKEFKKVKELHSRDDEWGIK